MKTNDSSGASSVLGSCSKVPQSHRDFKRLRQVRILQTLVTVQNLKSQSSESDSDSGQPGNQIQLTALAVISLMFEHLRRA